MTITFDLTPPSCPKTEEKMDRPQAVMALEQSREQISPATDLPMELLAAIFEYHCETIRLNPLDMSQPPWILGRVCTQWRAVSRNSSALWGSPRLELEVLKDILHLERALEVLPLRVISCPLDSFQNLHDVKITFWQRENFVCDPVIPGGYDMDVNGGVADDNTHGDAVFQVAAGPWDNAQKLSGVEFICSFWYCHALLNPSFSRIPLTQLECLVLDSVRMQMKPLCLMLEGCKSLKTLKIDLLLTGSKNLPMDTCLQFPHLQKLTLDGAAVLLIPIMYCWTNLSSFSASRFRVENERKVQDALRQCVNLKKLSIAAFYLPHEWLHIPLLQSLCVRMHESTHPIPSFNLVLPNLMHLDVTDYWDTAGADLLPVIEMLKASQCSLTHFECQTFVDHHYFSDRDVCYLFYVDDIRRFHFAGYRPRHTASKREQL
ncbi:hypothetical protein H0H92_012824 [Tricholoma furcatifolium]|nr:hypothetical protein H0H92_012824 [Tricholoma furcatifolium]